MRYGFNRYGIRGKYMKQIELVVGGITKLAVDAIVNAANRSLLDGGRLTNIKYYHSVYQ